MHSSGLQPHRIECNWWGEINVHITLTIRGESVVQHWGNQDGIDDQQLEMMCFGHCLLFISNLLLIINLLWWRECETHFTITFTSSHHNPAILPCIGSRTSSEVLEQGRRGETDVAFMAQILSRSVAGWPVVLPVCKWRSMHISFTCIDWMLESWAIWLASWFVWILRICRAKIPVYDTCESMTHFHCLASAWERRCGLSSRYTTTNWHVLLNCNTCVIRWLQHHEKSVILTKSCTHPTICSPTRENIKVEITLTLISIEKYWIGYIYPQLQRGWNDTRKVMTISHWEDFTAESWGAYCSKWWKNIQNSTENLSSPCVECRTHQK